MSSRGEASFVRISPRRAAFPEKHGKPGDLKSHSGLFRGAGALYGTENRALGDLCGTRQYSATFRHGAAAAECFPERGRQDEKQKGR